MRPRRKKSTPLPGKGLYKKDKEIMYFIDKGISITTTAKLLDLNPKVLGPYLKNRELIQQAFKESSFLSKLGRTRLSDSQQERAIELRRAGHSFDEIGDEIGLDKATTCQCFITPEKLRDPNSNEFPRIIYGQYLISDSKEPREFVVIGELEGNYLAVEQARGHGTLMQSMELAQRFLRGLHARITATLIRPVKQPK